MGFPDSSVDKESGEILYQDTLVQSLGWEDPLEKGKATHSSILAWVAKCWTLLSSFHFILNKTVFPLSSGAEPLANPLVSFQVSYTLIYFLSIALPLAEFLLH